MVRLKSNAAAFAHTKGRIIAWRATLAVAISYVALALATDAQATTLTFDDLPTPSAGTLAVPAGYGGLNWQNFGYLDPVDRYGTRDTGYLHGMISSPNVAYNRNDDVAPATISGSQFTFDSAYFTGAWNDGLIIQVTGYSGGVLVDNAAVTVDSTSPTLEVFNWSGIDELVFSTSGGVNHGYGSGGEEFAVDNMTIDKVPEPSALALLGIGALSLLAYDWRPRNRRVGSLLAAVGAERVDSYAPDKKPSAMSQGFGGRTEADGG
jgi:hypothetical protein